MHKRKVVNPALMMVVQLDSAPAATPPSSTRQHAEETEDRGDVRDRHRSTALHHSSQ
jgi:hypothetical protein